MDLIASMAMPQLSTPLPQAERAGGAFSALLSDLGLESDDVALKPAPALASAESEAPAVPPKLVGTALPIPDLRPILGDSAGGVEAAQPGDLNLWVTALPLSDEAPPPKEPRSKKAADGTAAPLLSAFLAAPAPLPTLVTAPELAASPAHTPELEPSQGTRGAADGANAPTATRLNPSSTPLQSATGAAALTTAPAMADLGAGPTPRAFSERIDGLTGTPVQPEPCRRAAPPREAEAAPGWVTPPGASRQAAASVPAQGGREEPEVARTPPQPAFDEDKGLDRRAESATFFMTSPPLTEEREAATPSQNASRVPQAPSAPAGPGREEAQALGKPPEAADEPAPDPLLKRQGSQESAPQSAAARGDSVGASVLTRDAGASASGVPPTPAGVRAVVSEGGSVASPAPVTAAESKGASGAPPAAASDKLPAASSQPALAPRASKRAEPHPERAAGAAPAEVALSSSRSTQTPFTPAAPLPQGKAVPAETLEAKGKRPGDATLTAAVSSPAPTASAEARLSEPGFIATLPAERSARMAPRHDARATAKGGEEPSGSAASPSPGRVASSEQGLLPQSRAPVPGKELADPPVQAAKAEPQRSDAQAPSREAQREPVAEGSGTPAQLVQPEPAAAHSTDDRPAQPELRADEPLRLHTDSPASRAAHPPAPHQQVEPDQPLAAQLRPALEQLGERPVEIRLDPAELGKVTLTLSLDDTRPQIVIGAERAETLDLFRRHAESLIADFRALGFGGLSLAFGQSPQRGERQTESEGEDAPTPEAPPIASLPASGPRPAKQGAGVDLRS